VLWSFLYLVLRQLLQLVVLLGRSQRSKELEILVVPVLRPGGVLWVAVGPDPARRSTTTPQKASAGVGCINPISPQKRQI
jgi:hypothetical protein